MIVWESRWRTKGVPEVGDYIQCYCCKKSEISVCRTDEGIVAEVSDDSIVRFVGERHSIDSPEALEWECLRWRRGAMPETQYEFRREEIEA